MKKFLIVAHYSRFLVQFELNDVRLLQLMGFEVHYTYDEATVKAIALMKTEGCPMYISDGYALHPYQRNGVYFLPTLFDTPHKLPMQGIYTFVYHPNNMQEQDFAYLEDFLKKYALLFRSADEIMEKYDSVKNQGILGKIIEHAIYFLRGIKGSKE